MQPYQQRLAPPVRGSFTEVYTPKSGRITSPASANSNGGVAQKREVAYFVLPATATISYKDWGGNSVSSVSFAAGVWQIPVIEISACSGKVMILHDMLICQTEAAV